MPPTSHTQATVETEVAPPTAPAQYYTTTTERIVECHDTRGKPSTVVTREVVTAYALDSEGAPRATLTQQLNHQRIPIDVCISLSPFTRALEGDAALQYSALVEHVRRDYAFACSQMSLIFRDAPEA